MPTVRYDDRSYIVDDRRIWLSSGAIHYFRVPRALWRDRLTKAKRCGLNCIETYVAWNVHEGQEGRWDFAGERDVREFIIAAAELGLYVILRPGPYICAEWDFGGLPAWLASKSGIAYRTVNATYMHYFDKYLGQLLPRLADLQVTRGGNIILIQNENEYLYTAMPDRLNYCQFITQLFRRSGFDIPVITCNWCSEPKVPDTVECANGYDNMVQSVKRLRAFQPGAPLLATEFWSGWFDCWGGRHQAKDAAETARRALELLGCGCQVNYYMWHGGTNFGFYGSRLTSGEAAYQTTSYDYDAPLAEGGGLTRKYYLTKLVNMLANHFGPVLAACRPEGPGVTIHSGTQALNLTGPSGRIAVITRNGQREVATARVSLPGGRDLEVALGEIGAVAIALDIRLASDRVLDYANLMPLGLFGEGTLALHGPAGFAGVISIDGQEVAQTVPAADEVALLEHRGQRLVVVNSDLAQRTWEVNGSLVFGPQYVGASLEEIVPARSARDFVVLSPQGELSRRKCRPPGAPKSAPKPGPFVRVCVCDEPINADLPWEKLDRPKDLAALGIGYGYGWYRLEVRRERAGRAGLFLPECEDRAHIYVNGESAGVWGRGPGAVRQPIPVHLRKGHNVLTFLVDNLGRFNFGPNFGQPKGLYGTVWQAEQLQVERFKIRPGGDFSRRMVPRMQSHLIRSLEAGPFSTAETTLSLPKVHPVHLSYTDVRRQVIVICNGRQAAFLPDSGGFGDVTLGNELQKGRNTLTLLLWGQAAPADLDRIRLHALTDCISAGGTWSSRKWGAPIGQGRLVGKQLPAWYRSRFKLGSAQRSNLFLRLAGVRKGQIYLNGHNVGRFWSIGPQEYYYLPEPYLAAENDLMIFEEHGHIPAGSKLVYRPNGPYQQ